MLELRARGHEVVGLSRPTVAPTLTALNIEFRADQMSPWPSDLGPDNEPPTDLDQALRRKIHVAHTHRDQVARLLKQESFDLVLADGFRLYVLFFLEIGNRCVHLAGCTAAPTGAWVVQQARQLAWKLQDGQLQVRFLILDRDAKFTTGFDEVFRSEGVEVIPLPYRAPVANSFAERFVGTARRELLDHLLIFGQRHLEHVLREFIEHYHEERPHQGMEQQVPRPREPMGAIAEGGPVLRRDRLGGVLHEYFRQAA